METLLQLSGSSSMESNPQACPLGVKAWLIPTSGEWSLFLSSFPPWMQSNTKL
jgi:hypothetical protein